MNTKTILEIVTVAFVVSLVAAAPSFGTAFADDSQATSQTNDCGNGNTPSNVFCQNINSQVQGDDNNQEDVFGEQNTP